MKKSSTSMPWRRGFREPAIEYVGTWTLGCVIHPVVPHLERDGSRLYTRPKSDQVPSGISYRLHENRRRQHEHGRGLN